MKQEARKDDDLLDQFLKLRPARAMDRLLSQNPVEKVFSIYGTLQERIKKNTSELRTTLTQKYENLVDCSNLLDKIQDFTLQIQGIQKDISLLLNKDPLQQQNVGEKEAKSVVSLVEENLLKKKYLQAMNSSHSVNPMQLNGTERLYLPFLRIQILEELEKQLISKKITSKAIQQTIGCLSAYVDGLTDKERTELINTAELEPDSLLSLLSAALSSELKEEDILQIVFKCKLFSLNRVQPGVRQDDKISKFFYDIYQLIGEQRSNSQISRLASIFCQNLKQIEIHLSETFIVSNDSQVISFRYDLYERLLSSKEFMSILDNLHIIIRQNYAQAPEVSLRQNFLNLWSNYYEQLLSLLIAGCDPTQHYGCVLVAKDDIPAEFKKYLCNVGTKVQEQITKYDQNVQILISNLEGLLKKGVELSKNSLTAENVLIIIRESYLSKINQLNEKISQKCVELTKQTSFENLRLAITLFLLCDHFNQSIIAKANEQSLLQDIATHHLKWNEDITQKYSQCFGKNGKWNIEFDTFFIEYNPDKLTQTKLEIVQRVIILILEGIMLRQSPQRARKIIDEMRQRAREREKQKLDRLNRISDLPVHKVSASTFAKKK